MDRKVNSNIPNLLDQHEQRIYPILVPLHSAVSLQRKGWWSSRQLVIVPSLSPENLLVGRLDLYYRSDHHKQPSLLLIDLVHDLP